MANRGLSGKVLGDQEARSRLDLLEFVETTWPGATVTFERGKVMFLFPQIYADRIAWIRNVVDGRIMRDRFDGIDDPGFDFLRRFADLKQSR